MHQIVEISTTMFGEDRFEVAGETIGIEPGLATSLAMTLHELCTNAMKYGSLSNEMGRVAISWSVDSVKERKMMTFTWKEVGGPPVSEPERIGFGLKLITRAAAASSGANVEHEFHPAGVRCVVRVPIDEGLIK